MLLVVYDLVLSPPCGTCFECREHIANLVSSATEKYSQILHLFWVDVNPCALITVLVNASDIQFDPNPIC